MNIVRKQCYVVDTIADLPVHLRDRTPFALKNTEIVLRFPRGEVFDSDGQVKMVGAIEFQTQITPARLSEVCDPDELYKSEMKQTHRFRCVYDPQLQRGIKETSEGPKEFLRENQVTSMMKDIEEGRFQCPQLMWNLRAGESVWAYVKDLRELRIYEGVATRPDTNHRHQAIVRFQRQYQQWVAQTGSEKMGGYSPSREFGLAIYTDDYQGEAHRSYVYNTLGWKVSAGTADYLKSKTDVPHIHAKLARELMEKSEVLGYKNVELLTNHVPKNSAKMVSFHTLHQALREAFPRLTEGEAKTVLENLLHFFHILSDIRKKEIAILESSQRQLVRESSLADHPIAWYAYFKLVALAHVGTWLNWKEKLRKLEVKEIPTNETVDILSLKNPVWANLDVVLQGRNGLQARNNARVRQRFFEHLREYVGATLPEASREPKTTIIAPSTNTQGGKEQFHARIPNSEDSLLHQRLGKKTAESNPSTLNGATAHAFEEVPHVGGIEENGLKSTDTAAQMRKLLHDPTPALAIPSTISPLPNHTFPARELKKEPPQESKKKSPFLGEFD